MSDPVLPGEGPMTDEELRSAAELLGLDTPGTWTRSERNAIIAATSTAARRLLTEVTRLRADLVAEETDCRNLEEGYVNAMDDAGNYLTELDRSRSECAALAAKVEAAEAENSQNLRVINQLTADNAGLTSCLDAVIDVITPKNPDWKPLSERYPEHFTPDTPEEAARKKGWRQGEEMLTQRIRAALDGSGMPHPPAQEASIPMQYGPDCAHKPEWHCSAHGECRACECGCFTYPPTPTQEGHREAPQEAQERPETPGTGSDRGTGVPGAPGTAQASDG